MRYHICTAVGILGSLMSALFGGWDAALATLVILMGIDYISRQAGRVSAGKALFCALC